MDARQREVEGRQHQEGELIAQAVDLFRRRDLNWVDADGRFVLSLGKAGFIALARSDGQWRVLLVQRNDRKVLAEGLDLGYAQGVGEDHARRLGTDVLLDRGAAWRQREPSEKQLKVLVRRGLPVYPDMNRGEASDLLSAAFVGVPG